MDALAHQVLFQLQIVFDDAVVDDGDPPVLTDVGVGVDVIGLPVGGPAGVADAQISLQVRAAVDQVRESLQPALGLADLEPRRLRPDRHAGGVIAPVLHPLQAVQQNGRRGLVSYKSNDSAHSFKILLKIPNEWSKGQTRSHLSLSPRSQPPCFAVARIFAGCVRARGHGRASAEIFDTPFPSSSRRPRRALAL